MWFLLQCTIITLVAGWLYGQTPNPYAAGLVGVAAAWLATWILSKATPSVSLLPLGLLYQGHYLASPNAT